MTDRTDADLGDVIDAGPVPSHLLLELDGDDLEVDDGADSDVGAARAGSEMVDAGPPPADLLAMADDSEDDEETQPSTEPTDGE